MTPSITPPSTPSTAPLASPTPRSAAQHLGRIGMPAPLSELAGRAWDAIVVGAGHNGLTAAAYLARAGKRVLVLESRERIGGACTLEEPWPGYRVSPCAYLAGLLHTLVIEELDLVARGFRWTPADGGMFVPFEDGSAVQLWEDSQRCEDELRRFAPGDIDGYRALQELVGRTAEALRPAGERDLWIGDAPTRGQIADRLSGDPDALGLVFEWSQADLVDRYLTDERLRMALLGQGVIGTRATPFDAGTASIYLHHSSGRIDPYRPGTWGFVEGGMGMVSFLLHDAAVEAGAVVAAGVPVARIVPGEGVLLDDGTAITAPTVVCNADPQIAKRLLAEAADPTWRAAVDAVPMEGCTVKASMALSRPPDFIARPGTDGLDGVLPHHRAQINTPLTAEEWMASFEAAQAGRVPDLVWTEDYLQTAYDTSIAPPGRHVMSVFAQYVPRTFADGRCWDDARDEIGRVVVRSLGRFLNGFESSILEMEVMGPPDIEAKVGLTGGHIFQGECLPDHMWDRRLTARTPMPGVYLCGAGTYPGGSVMAINGRNAAMAVLADDAAATSRSGAVSSAGAGRAGAATSPSGAVSSAGAPDTGGRA